MKTLAVNLKQEGMLRLLIWLLGSIADHKQEYFGADHTIHGPFCILIALYENVRCTVGKNNDGENGGRDYGGSCSIFIVSLLRFMLGPIQNSACCQVHLSTLYYFKPSSSS